MSVRADVCQCRPHFAASLAASSLGWRHQLRLGPPPQLLTDLASPTPLWFALLPGQSFCRHHRPLPALGCPRAMIIDSADSSLSPGSRQETPPINILQICSSTLCAFEQLQFYHLHNDNTLLCCSIQLAITAIISPPPMIYYNEGLLFKRLAINLILWYVINDRKQGH